MTTADTSRWIPVTESLPDDDEMVLIWLDDAEPWTGYMDAGQWYYASGDSLGARVSHWMPFPSGPTETTHKAAA